jgi:hypothetical protein
MIKNIPSLFTNYKQFLTIIAMKNINIVENVKIDVFSTILFLLKLGCGFQHKAAERVGYQVLFLKTLLKECFLVFYKTSRDNNKNNKNKD